MAPFSATATAALPSGSLGISDANALREVWSEVTLSRGGMMLSRAKNPKLSTGRKNKNTSHNGSRADLSRRTVNTIPTQTNGRAIASSVTRNLVSVEESDRGRITSTGGIQ